MEQGMAYEIERKFLVKNDSWKNGRQGLYCRQGYLVTGEVVTVRVRILGGEGFLTVKGRTEGITRDEFEYRIPLEDASAMLGSMSSGGIVEKIRYHIEVQGFTWDVDEFLGENCGLVLAEVELEDEDQVPEFPDWLGQEVTGDVRYYNAYLAGNPFSAWKK
jgi:adenylate cyclase